MFKRFLHHDLPVWWRKACVPLLALSWCAGLLLGVILASGASDHLVSMMRRAAGTPVSIFGLLAATVFPFLISVCAVSVSEPRLLLIIGFLDAFSYGFCAHGVGLAFGSAAWLVRILLLFSNGCMALVLYWYWLRHISGERPNSRPELGAIGVLCVLVGSIDYCLISPFLVRLIDI